jgi:hypothetical protein
MKTGLLRLCGLLLLASLVTACAYAQNDTLAPSIPLSPGLAPPLTDTPQDEPVTTLTTDLLTPQRSFIFDPSGASISANSLNPEIYSSPIAPSLAETDTQIRDSAQTGQISPYASTAQRLGLDFSGGEASSSSQNNGITSTGSFHRIHSAGSESGQTSMGNPYQSSWSARSSFDPEPNDNSWGTRRLSGDRLGHKQQDSLAATPSVNSELAAIGGSTAKSTNSLASRYGRGRINSSAYGSIDGRARTTYAGNNSGQSPTGDLVTSSRRNPIAGGAKNHTSRDEDSARNTLTFFPQAGYSQVPVGESPFSSPSGIDELHFLNPDIYAATSQSSSRSIKERGSATDNSLRQTFVQHDHLDSSASHYGLNTHPGADGSAKSSLDKSRLEKDSHLRTGLLDSEHP